MRRLALLSALSLFLYACDSKHGPSDSDVFLLDVRDVSLEVHEQTRTEEEILYECTVCNESARSVRLSAPTAPGERVAAVDYWVHVQDRDTGLWSVVDSRETTGEGIVLPPRSSRTFVAEVSRSCLGSRLRIGVSLSDAGNAELRWSLRSCPIPTPEEVAGEEPERAAEAVGGDKAGYATEKDLLTLWQETVVRRRSDKAFDFTEQLNSGYVLAFEDGPLYLGGQRVRIRVWRKCVGSWPGSNPQVIQVVGEDSRVMGARKVGGQPMMGDAWTARYGRRFFVYIKCAHRSRPGPGTYVYEICDDYSIKEQGVFFEKEVIEKDRERTRELLKKHMDRSEKPVGEGAVSPEKGAQQTE